VERGGDKVFLRIQRHETIRLRSPWVEQIIESRNSSNDRLWCIRHESMLTVHILIFAGSTNSSGPRSFIWRCSVDVAYILELAQKILGQLFTEDTAKALAGLLAFVVSLWLFYGPILSLVVPNKKCPSPGQVYLRQCLWASLVCSLSIGLLVGLVYGLQLFDILVGKREQLLPNLFWPRMIRGVATTSILGILSGVGIYWWLRVLERSDTLKVAADRSFSVLLLMLATALVSGWILSHLDQFGTDVSRWSGDTIDWMGSGTAPNIAIFNSSPTSYELGDISFFEICAAVTLFSVCYFYRAVKAMNLEAPREKKTIRLFYAVSSIIIAALGMLLILAWSLSWSPREKMEAAEAAAALMPLLIILCAYPVAILVFRRAD
jgi:hypothetical protein